MSEPTPTQQEAESPVQGELPSVSSTPAPEEETKRRKKATASAQPPADSEAPTAAIDEEASKTYNAKIKELESVISELQKNMNATDDEVATHRASMKDSLLARLNVIDKYRSFAPDVDPFTDEGKQTLEAWAADNPEILAVRPQPVVDVDTDKLKTNMRSPHLVDFSTFSKSMKRG